MRIIRRSILTALLPLVLVGCASPARRHVLPKGAPVWVEYSADRRGGFLLPAGEKYTVCQEPFPDVALSRAIGVAASYQLPTGADVGARVDYATAVVQLAGRSQTILFLRECLASLCVQAANGKLTNADVRALYEKVLEAALALARAAAANEVAQAVAVTPDPGTREKIMRFFATPEANDAGP